MYYAQADHQSGWDLGILNYDGREAKIKLGAFGEWQGEVLVLVLEVTCDENGHVSDTMGKPVRPNNFILY